MTPDEAMTRRSCPRCHTFVTLADLRLYDYRDGFVCVCCEVPEDRTPWLRGAGQPAAL